MCVIDYPCVFGVAGSSGDLYESNSLRLGQGSLSQGNLSQSSSPSWQGDTSELDSAKQIIRRSQTTAALPECRPHPPLSRVCSTPQIEVSRRNANQSNSEHHFPVSASDDLVAHDSDAAFLHTTAKPLYLRPGQAVRKDRPPPPPYPDAARQSFVPSLRTTGSSAEHSLWKPQRPETSSSTLGGGRIMARVPEHSDLCEEQHNQMGIKYSNPDCEQNSKNVSDPDWCEWQRDRWQIWEFLSPDNPDALPETLVWVEIIVYTFLR